MVVHWFQYGRLVSRRLIGSGLNDLSRFLLLLGFLLIFKQFKNLSKRLLVSVRDLFLNLLRLLSLLNLLLLRSL